MDCCEQGLSCAQAILLSECCRAAGRLGSNVRYRNGIIIYVAVDGCEINAGANDGGPRRSHHLSGSALARVDLVPNENSFSSEIHSGDVFAATRFVLLGKRITNFISA